MNSCNTFQSIYQTWVFRGTVILKHVLNKIVRGVKCFIYLKRITRGMLYRENSTAG